MCATAIITGITLAGIMIDTALLIQPSAAQTPHRFFGFIGSGGFGSPVDNLAMLGPGTLGAENVNDDVLAETAVAPADFGVIGAWQIDVPLGAASQQPGFAGDLTTIRDASAIAGTIRFRLAMSLASARPRATIPILPPRAISAID